MTNKWVDELRHLSLWTGFTPDPEVRAENIARHRPLARLGPEWLKAHNHATDPTAIDPDIINSPEAREFLEALSASPAINRFLYNAGVTHVLVEGSITDETIYSRDYPAVGVYHNKMMSAVTSAATKAIEDNETVASVTRHESGHAFSYNASKFKPVEKAMRQDLEALKERWDELPPELQKELKYFTRTLGFFTSSKTGEGSLPASTSNLLAKTMFNEPNLKEYLPITTRILESVNYFDAEEPPEIQMRLSEHKYIVEAYKKDLLAIINGEGPEGARFEVRNVNFRGLQQDRAVIVIEQSNGEERVIDIDHYVPGEFEGHFIGGEKTGETEYDLKKALTGSREEAFAEVFEDVTGITTRSDLAHYFPNMATELRQIVEATEILASRENNFKRMSEAIPTPIPAETLTVQ